MDTICFYLNLVFWGIIICGIGGPILMGILIGRVGSSVVKRGVKEALEESDHGSFHKNRR